MKKVVACRRQSSADVNLWNDRERAVINDLDNTLATLLKSELPAELVQQVTISFAAPDSEFPPATVKLPAIDLFLYDVRENWELRNNEWVTNRSNGMVTKQGPPIRVDCSYLVTAWPSKSVQNPAEDEHKLLGEIVQILVRHRRLPAAVLQGKLQGQEPPLRTKVLQTANLQSVGEFWQALGGRPKVALHYTITISVPTAEPLVVGPPVIEKIIR